MNWNIEKNKLISLDGKESIGIGQTLISFNERFYSNHDNSLKSYVNAPRWFCYSFNDIIHFHFNAENGLLETIYLEEGFKGKYKNIISIGSTIGELLKIENDYSIGDDCILLTDYGIAFATNEDLEVLEDEDIHKCIIERIY